MNLLEQHIADNHLNPDLAMNALQDAGIISDLCVTPSDVANANCFPAIVWLDDNFQPT